MNGKRLTQLGRDPGRLRRQPRLDPVLGDRARRGAEGRRLRGLRQRRDRRRDQLHPAPGLPRRGDDGFLRCAHARRRRREVERDGSPSASAISRRTSTTSSSRRITRRRSRSTRTSATSPNSSIDLDQGLFGIVRQHVLRRTSATGAHRRPPAVCLTRIARPRSRSTVEPCLRTRPGAVYDPAAADGVNAIPEQETTSFFASGRWQFNPNWQLYGTVPTRRSRRATSSSRRRSPTRSPTARTGNFLSTFLLQPTSPFYPDARSRRPRASAVSR